MIYSYGQPNLNTYVCIRLYYAKAMPLKKNVLTSVLSSISRHYERLWNWEISKIMNTNGKVELGDKLKGSAVVPDLYTNENFKETNRKFLTEKIEFVQDFVNMRK